MSRSKSEPKPRRSKLYRKKNATHSTKPTFDKRPHFLSKKQPWQVGEELYRAGKFDQARRQLLESLRHSPEKADAWHILGLTLRQLGFLDQAIECLEKADRLIPERPDILSNLAVVYRESNQNEKALKSVKKALTANPHCTNARNIHAVALMECERIMEAESEFRSLLTRDPANVEAGMNLGNLLQKQGRLQDAIDTYRQALKTQPNHELLQFNLCEALRGIGQHQPAINGFRQILAKNPKMLAARINLARTLGRLGQYEDAVRQLQTVIQSSPEHAKATHYLAKMLLELGQQDQAEQLLLKSVKLLPNDPFVRCTLGRMYSDSHQLSRAETYLREALEVAPELHEANSGLLFVLSGQSSRSDQELFQAHLDWGARFDDVDCFELDRHDFGQRRKLRLGYVSPDFRQHPIASYFLPVLRNHNREQFEVYCYAELKNSDSTTDEIRELSDGWFLTNGCSDLQVANRVRSDQIDILFDLAGHTRGNRLGVFAYRPVPVQITWLGYPHTTGLRHIDFRLTCEVQNPSDTPEYHSESLVRLPHGSFCFSPPSNAPELTALPAAASGNITFGSLHRPFKINLDVLSTWARVLNAVPQSRLLLLNTRFTTSRKQQVENTLVDLGVDANRISIRNEINQKHYLEVYREIDIALDVFPWAGGTTTLEALWMGIPLIAFCGKRRSSRSTAAIVTHAGHPELVAHSQNEYVRLVCHLAADLKRLLAYRANLRKTLRDTIADAARFTQTFEDKMKAIWTEKCREIRKGRTDLVRPS